MAPLALLLVLALVPRDAGAQRTAGQVHVEAVDAGGAPVEAQGTIESAGTQVRRAFTLDATGSHIAVDLPFGVYRVEVVAPGFERHSAVIDVRSELPIVHSVTLILATFEATVTVTSSADTLLDPFRGAAVQSIGSDLLRDRPVSAPGRSLIDLINTQPGWLLEANGILHARGSEYQVQYVIDGIPLRDNRSPAFAQSLGIEEFESMTVRTGGYPAEFGGKLGAVIEVNTTRDPRPGFHGIASLDAGSFSMLNGYAFGQYAAQGTTVGFTVERMRTDRYLDPPNENNFTNDGDAHGLSGRLEHVWSDGNRTHAYVYRRNSRFLVPNEAIQHAAGQSQERATREHLGLAAHQQVLSPQALANVRLMVRDSDATLVANPKSIPIRPSQDRSVREVHANGSVSFHRGRHELKAGGETTFATIDERFDATVTARSLGNVRVFDESVPDQFSFEERGHLRQHALFIQNLARLGPLTLAVGLRFDAYHLRDKEYGMSPRVSGSWFAAPLDLVLHASYDRTFETPPIENILLASANVVEQLGGNGESLRLRSSRGHFLEAGFSKRLFTRFRLDGTVFTRRSSDAVDDEVLLNTGIGVPLTFSHASVTGLETKLDLAPWGPLSGWTSYSYSVGTGELPFAGGLFLGDEAEELLDEDGTFRLSQDQRHTWRARVRGQLAPRVWAALAGRYDSGLPIEVEEALDLDLLVQQYGAEVVAKADLDEGRVRPSWSLDASAGVTLFDRSNSSLRLQADVLNLTDRLNVINFAGLLSGTAVAPRRTVSVRLRAGF